MSLSALRGQPRAQRLLLPLLKSKRLPPALLFHGPEGVGKALAGLEVGKALNCEKPSPSAEACDECRSCVAAHKGIDPDLKRVNAQYQAGLREEEAERQRTIRVDTVRHLIKDVEMTSLTGRWKTAILEDAERLETEAANALLKSLEEPPARTLWILVTSRRERVLPTILSRCHRVPFGTLPETELVSILKGCGLPAPEAARLARLAEGSPGRALRLRELGLADGEDGDGTPLAPFRLADRLPRELHLARPVAEAQLRRIAWRIRDKGRLGFPGAGASLREIARLGSYLRSNVDPRLLVQLAALELERFS
ncbi:MAG: DNA polymerase III subunit delta' [Elusimicrobia bacterium]|nr:DNA polymerase III subunit delta' [Elusimicrobiota bacterium]